MTPFALQLRATRAAYGLAQGEFAARVGYRQSYISAIECGSKLPRDARLIDRTISALDLDDTGATALRAAFRRSQRYDFPPPGTPAFAYDVCARLSDVIPRLTQADAKALYEFLNLLDRVRHPSSDAATQAIHGAA
jgi:transcriptional regulator with XRE-family HTH domain